MYLLLNVLGVAILAITLPLLAELLVLSLAACLPPRRPARNPSTVFNLAVIIPAHNEEKLIARCVASVRESAFPSVSIFVVAHNCTDATSALASAAGANVLILNEMSGRGKGLALHHGFTHAINNGADAVLVIDADSTISPNLLAEVSAALNAGSEAVQCRYVAANAGASTQVRLLALALTGMNHLRPRGRSRLWLSCGIFGNGFALRASALHTVPYLAHSVVEDLEYHLLLLHSGIRVDFLGYAAVCGELPEKSGAAVTQHARWEGGRSLMRRRFAPSLVVDILSGELQLIEPLLDLLSLPLATGAAVLLVGLLIPVRWIRFYSAEGLAILLLYVLVAALLTSEPLDYLRSLALAPFYFVFKIASIPAKRRASRADAAWVRTDRNDIDR